MKQQVVLGLVLVQSLSCAWIFATPWKAACQTSLSFTISWSLLKFMSIESVMLSKYFILCHPSFCLQSFPASGSFPVSWLFPSHGHSVGVSASTSILSMNIPGCFHFGLTGLISSQVFSSTTVQKHQFFSAQPSLWSDSHIHAWLLEKPQFWLYDFVRKVISFLFLNFLLFYFFALFFLTL